MPFTQQDLNHQTRLGEDSARQFKVDVRNGESLAAEMVAFANSEGGTLFIGVADDGSLPGLSTQDVARVNQLISNAASQLVRSPLTVQTENVALESGRIVVVLRIPKGVDKPYFDKNGVIWLKTGADKRRVNSKEELRRLFQMTDQFHADQLPTKAGIDKLDKLRFRDFLRDFYKQPLPDSPAELTRLLQNMNLATDDGHLNLAGVLMFAERPEWIAPQFVIKAIRYPGNQIHTSEYVDTEDFAGPLSKMFSDALGFVMRNLHKTQAGRGVNAPGQPEIPESVFEELLVNALVHRDYLVSAPIRLFVFDNRIEIISPGHLPDNLTVEKIRTGNSNIRNPILVSYVAKGLLPYHGLGSGIKRALTLWPDIEFTDDRDGCLFTASIRREPVSEVVNDGASEGVIEGVSEGVSEGVHALLKLIRQQPGLRSPAMADTLHTSVKNIERWLKQLKDNQRIEFRGAPKTGGYHPKENT
ncbi:MAG: putative DNA binding domain-containing protein [Hydrogenophaga sp.]|uniref:RNA-binding domain-containing protein n=1 Tax=Hydrogenophaga sp. TaxID=1904254 RepID=UPI00272FD577|nr:RNA-binding domain-containing protein [Hydrogenophaga sp.]MDP2163220.1 putative DNA binding domain-containing protein [Hydrogenophaga sp.]MDP3476317.1 putative DNA binding domain-containing protein [Hydrogenophaga sp.]